jgi:hypothetical protein
MHILLNSLPTDHVLRNTPLIELNAKYKSKGFITYAEITPAFGIAKKTFNQLGDVWTDGTEWIAVTTGEVWDESRMDIIGQNGNEGLHYGLVDSNKSGADLHDGCPDNRHVD